MELNIAGTESCRQNEELLKHSTPLVFFYTPWKHQKTRGYLTFSGGIEREQWYEKS